MAQEYIIPETATARVGGLKVGCGGTMKSSKDGRFYAFLEVMTPGAEPKSLEVYEGDTLTIGDAKVTVTAVIYSDDSDGAVKLQGI